MDNQTASLLLESLRPYAPVIPHPDDPREYLNYGFATANQLNANALAGQRLALGAEQLRLLPMDRKYKETDAALQAAQLDIARANARRANAAADLYSKRAEFVGVPRAGSVALPLDDFNPPRIPGGTANAPDASYDPLPVDDGLPSIPTMSAPVDNSSPSVDDDGAETDDSLSRVESAFKSRATGYHPVAPSDPNYKMEGGSLDAMGQPIHTLDAYRRGEAPDVTVAIDKSSPLFGKKAYSPELAAPVRFTDTGSAFRGKGNSRVDVARDSAAGANSDENNRSLTFTVGDGGQASAPPAAPVQPANPYNVSDFMGESLEPINGAYLPGDPGYVAPSQPSPTAALMGHGDPSLSIPKVNVPTNDDEARALREYLMNYRDAHQIDPRRAGDKTLTARLALVERSVGGAIGQYERNKAAAYRRQQDEAQRQAAAARTAAPRGRALNDPGSLENWQKAGFDPDTISLKTEQGNVTLKYNPALKRAEDDVKSITGGATIQDILNDRGNFKDDPVTDPKDPNRIIAGGRVTPETHYYTRYLTNQQTGTVTPVEVGMPESAYRSLRAMVDPLIYGSQAQPGAPTEAPTATSPNMLTVADEAKRIGGAGPVVPVKLTMGGRRGFVPDPSYAPPVSTAPAAPAVPSTPPVIMPSKLAAAAAKVQPQTEAEKRALPLLKEDAVQNSQKNRDAAADSVNQKSLAYHMTQELSPVDDKIKALNERLERAQVGDTASAGFYPGGAMPTGGVDNRLQVELARKIQELRAEREAVLDRKNYKLLPGGAYQYIDPFDAAPLPTSFNQIDTSAGKVTVKKSQ